MSMKYSEEHEWVTVEGDIATIGITDYAQNSLGDIVFVEAPEVGSGVYQGNETGVVESVKAASDIITPVSGEIVEINEALDAAPSTVNSDPTGDGWLFKIKLSDTEELDGLMDDAAYKTYCEGLDG